MDRRQWDRIVGGGWWFCDLVRYLAFAIAGGYSALSTAPIVLGIASWALMSVVQAGLFFGKKWAFWVTIMINAMVIFLGLCEFIGNLLGAGSASSVNYGSFIESIILFGYSLYVLSRPQKPPLVADLAHDQ